MSYGHGNLIVLGNGDFSGPDSTPIASIGVKAGDFLEGYVEFDFGQIFVKTLTGKTITLDCACT